MIETRKRVLVLCTRMTVARNSRDDEYETRWRQGQGSEDSYTYQGEDLYPLVVVRGCQVRENVNRGRVSQAVKELTGAINLALRTLAPCDVKVLCHLGGDGLPQDQLRAGYWDQFLGYLSVLRLDYGTRLWIGRYKSRHKAYKYLPFDLTLVKEVWQEDDYLPIEPATVPDGTARRERYPLRIRWSALLHRLTNLFSPFDLDLQTWKETNYDPKVAEGIVETYRNTLIPKLAEARRLLYGADGHAAADSVESLVAEVPYDLQEQVKSVWARLCELLPKTNPTVSTASAGTGVSRVHPFADVLEQLESLVGRGDTNPLKKGLEGIGGTSFSKWYRDLDETLYEIEKISNPPSDLTRTHSGPGDVN